MGRVYPRYRYGLTCAMLLLTGLLAVQIGRGAEGMANSSRECAICHIRWVRAFDRNSSETTAMEAVMERQAGSGDMCLSCHDGSVADSRFKIWSTSHHTTDAVPSPAVKIPTDQFPLDAQGRMTCATCHTAHAVPNSSDLRTVVFLRQPNVDSSLCLSCHPEHAQKNDFQHPLGHSDSPVPTAILEAGGQTSEDGHGIICQTCHEPHGARNPWMLVLPPSKLCVACHEQKGPEAAPPAGAPVHRIGHTYPGFEPPASLLKEKATFGPKGELSCLSCHRLHDASGAKPLLIRKNEDSSLCLECHPQEKAVLGSPHDLRTSSPETVNADGEQASVSGPCGACHRIHGWARNVPDTGRPHSSGCMECHQTGGPGSIQRPYIEGHPVGVPAPEGVSIPWPVDEETNTIGCLTCHDPHLPRATGAETTQDTDSPVQTPRSFLRAEGSQLCVVCHNDKADSLPGVHDPAALAPAEQKALAVHPSIGSCRLCHTTHNPQGPHLWTRPPADSSAGPTSNLCGACHDEDLVTEPKGTHHPLTSMASLEGVSDPLLANTIAQCDTDGEVGCITCHDPHGDSGQATQLREAPVALCTRCHTDKQGVIGSAHDPGTADWGKELGWDSNDVCIDCHAVHGPEQESGLRAVLNPTSADQSLCEACHRLGAPGQAAETLHMGKVLDDEIDGHATGLPTGAGETVLCHTCHDIHQTTQPAKLLRAPKQGSTLCLTCHTAMAGLLDSPHDLRTSAPDLTNLQGETADESGPCTACHMVHPQAYGNGKWAHKAISGRDFGAGYCTGCHQPAGCAAGRVPAHADHPDVPIYNRTQPGDPDYRPTFDSLGKPSPNGAVSCLTCHEPHQAKADKAPPQRMFLRAGTRESLCVDCHGSETLWRFLYYHKANRNPHPQRDSSLSQEEP